MTLKYTFCAMIIASVGLNTGSTAVIIGAMLISPLMGSILAMAYGTVSNDGQLAGWHAVGLLIQVGISLIVSTLYFALSPVKQPTNELLARTTPAFFDAIIANLRAATVLQCRPTTHRDVILEIVNETGIDEAAFIDHCLNGSADAALKDDQHFAQHLGIHALPAYLLSYGGHGWILPFIENAGEFTLMIDRFVNESTNHD